MSRDHPTEIAADRGAFKAQREAEREALRLEAIASIGRLLAACQADQRPRLAIALLEGAAEAVSSLHDSARTQACLGAMARKHGSELPGVRNLAGRNAERLFRGRA